MLAWVVTRAGAVDFEIEIAMHGRVGEPYRGGQFAVVEVPTRIRPRESVTTEGGGFDLTCTGWRREIEVFLGYHWAAFPENAPAEVECAVGGHRVVVHLRNDHEVAWRAVDHVAFRRSRAPRAEYVQRLVLPSADAAGRAAWPDAPGRLVGPDGQRVEGLGCRIEDQMLFVDQRGEVAPGAYRCVVDGHSPIPIEILP